MGFSLDSFLKLINITLSFRDPAEESDVSSVATSGEGGVTLSSVAFFQQSFYPGGDGKHFQS
ncbi:MAG: hypothetical protein ACKOCM_08555 [Cyanobacteriota bacterium]